jgi:hypothetical protein
MTLNPEIIGTFTCECGWRLTVLSTMTNERINGLMDDHLDQHVRPVATPEGGR